MGKSFQNSKLNQQKQILQNPSRFYQSQNYDKNDVNFQNKYKHQIMQQTFLDLKQQYFPNL